MALAPALCLLETLYFLYALHVKPGRGDRAYAFERLAYAFAGLILAGSFAALQAVYAAASSIYPAGWSGALNSSLVLGERLAEEGVGQAAGYARWAAYLAAVGGVIEAVQAGLVVAAVVTGGFSLALWLKLQMVKSAVAAVQGLALFGLYTASLLHATGTVIASLCALMAAALPYLVVGG
ncbi:MAG: hypothetical protein DRK00_06510, partial [Thermoprotei archaeon]